MNWHNQSRYYNWCELCNPSFTIHDFPVSDNTAWLFLFAVFMAAALLFSMVFFVSEGRMLIP